MRVQAALADHLQRLAQQANVRLHGLELLIGHAVEASALALDADGRIVENHQLAVRRSAHIQLHVLRAIVGRMAEGIQRVFRIITGCAAVRHHAHGMQIVIAAHGQYLCRHAASARNGDHRAARAVTGDHAARVDPRHAGIAAGVGIFAHRVFRIGLRHDLIFIAHGDLRQCRQ